MTIFEFLNSLTLPFGFWCVIFAVLIFKIGAKQ
jgi:uncharacterized membrane protein